MRNRIAIWAALGFAVAGGWALYAFLTPPDSFLLSMRNPVIQVALYLSCPIAYAGRFYPIQFWWVLLANAAAYAAIGMIFEMFRLKPKPSLVA